MRLYLEQRISVFVIRTVEPLPLAGVDKALVCWFIKIVLKTSSKTAFNRKNITFKASTKNRERTFPGTVIDDFEDFVTIFIIFGD